MLDLCFGDEKLQPFPVFNDALAGFVIGDEKDIPGLVDRLRDKDISGIEEKKIITCNEVMKAVDLKDYI